MSESFSMRPMFSRYLVPKAKCSHPHTAQMVVGGIGRATGRPTKAPKSAPDVLCMNCGHKVSGRMPATAALHALWKQFGWSMIVGKRLCELSVRARRNRER